MALRELQLAPFLALIPERLRGLRSVARLGVARGMVAGLGQVARPELTDVWLTDVWLAGRLAMRPVVCLVLGPAAQLVARLVSQLVVHRRVGLVRQVPTPPAGLPVPSQLLAGRSAGSRAACPVPRLVARPGPRPVPRLVRAVLVRGLLVRELLVWELLVWELLRWVVRLVVRVLVPGVMRRRWRRARKVEWLVGGPLVVGVRLGRWPGVGLRRAVVRRPGTRLQPAACLHPAAVRRPVVHLYPAVQLRPSVLLRPVVFLQRVVRRRRGLEVLGWGTFGGCGLRCWRLLRPSGGSPGSC
ncbi:hypothetical protein GCM10010530_31360 [Kribbella aluminosa]